MRSSKYARQNINLKIFEGINNDLEENLLHPRYSPVCYNFTFEDGALKSNMGIDIAKTTTLNSSNIRHTLPIMPDNKKVKSIHLFRKYDFNNEIRDDKLIVRATDNYFYETKLFETDTFHQINNLTASGKDCSICYRYNNKDLFILSSEQEGLFIYDGAEVKKINTAPNITSMCIHSERVFATVTGEKNKVWFSSLFNPEDWVVSGDGAGYISFDDDGGKVIKVIQFLNYVYLFREFGIERITAYGNALDFSVSKLYMASSRIYPDTIVSMGDKIIFLAEEGLFACDGYSVKLVAKNLIKFLPIDKKDALAQGLNGKYYLAINLNYGFDNINPVLDETSGATTNNSMVIYDVKSDTFSIMRGADISNLCAVKIHTESSLLLAFKLAAKGGQIGRFVKSGKYLDEYFPKYWSTGYTDLGYPSRKKTVRNISLVTSCPLNLGVELDGNITEYPLKGNSLPQKIIVNKAGNRLRIFIKTNANNITAITAPTVTVDII